MLCLRTHGGRVSLCGETEMNVVVEVLEEKDNQLRAHRSIRMKGPM